MKPPTLPGPPVPPMMASPAEVAGQTWSPAPGHIMGMPVGAIVAFAGELGDPTGSAGAHETQIQHYDWKVCDGSPLRTDQFPDLFNALGYLYGKGDNDDFRLPNFQGYFLRTVDKTAGIDPDKPKRTSPDPEKKTIKYDGVGSLQDFKLQDHQHNLKESTSKVAVREGPTMKVKVQVPSLTTDASRTNYVVTDPVQVSQNETRSINAYVYWLIKCQPDS